MKYLLLSIIGVACVAPFAPSTAQKTQSAQEKRLTGADVRRVRTQPHIFISFERKGAIAPLYAGGGEERVWLRLNNNSRWRVSYCSSTVAKPFGDLELDYETERYVGFGVVPGTRSSGTCAYRSLVPGGSLLFSIPTEHLAVGLAIKLKFRYEWEIDPDGSDNNLEPRHYVYFYSEDVPK